MRHAVILHIVPARLAFIMHPVFDMPFVVLGLAHVMARLVVCLMFLLQVCLCLGGAGGITVLLVGFQRRPIAVHGRSVRFQTALVG